MSTNIHLLPSWTCDGLGSPSAPAARRDVTGVLCGFSSSGRKPSHVSSPRSAPLLANGVVRQTWKPCVRVDGAAVRRSLRAAARGLNRCPGIYIFISCPRPLVGRGVCGSHSPACPNQYTSPRGCNVLEGVALTYLEILINEFLFFVFPFFFF